MEGVWPGSGSLTFWLDRARLYMTAVIVFNVKSCTVESNGLRAKPRPKPLIKRIGQVNPFVAWLNCTGPCYQVLPCITANLKAASLWEKSKNKLGVGEYKDKLWEWAIRIWLRSCFRYDEDNPDLRSSTSGWYSGPCFTALLTLAVIFVSWDIIFLQIYIGEPWYTSFLTILF